MSTVSNMFTSRAALRSERAVERDFLYRLFEHLGYSDADVSVDEQIDQLRIPRGRQREPYRPDAVLFAAQLPRIVIEAKPPDEDATSAQYQAASYALMINRRYRDFNPVQYCIHTNGLVTYVMPWDSAIEIVAVDFTDWTPENPKTIWVSRRLAHAAFHEEMWYHVRRVGNQPSTAEAEMLLRNGALSPAAVTRFLLVAKHDPAGFGTLLENPWHRKAYSELASLGWIEPEPIDREHYSKLMGQSDLSESEWGRAVGFNLTASGREVYGLFKADYELRARFQHAFP